MNYKSWETYLQYVKNIEHYQGIALLAVGDTSSLAPVTYENLFVYIPTYEELVQTYEVLPCQNDLTAFQKALSIMNWLTKNTYYNGMQDKALPDDSLQILSFSVGKGFQNAINCRCKAIVSLASNGAYDAIVRVRDGKNE